MYMSDLQQYSDIYLSFMFMIAKLVPIPLIEVLIKRDILCLLKVIKTGKICLHFWF